jgi:hypothetical protein
MSHKSRRRFLLMTAAANMPSTCKGRYGRIAVVELEPGFVGRPKMISGRARGVKKIVELWDRLHRGGRYSAHGKAHAAAQNLCETLNGEWGLRAQRDALKDV